jgi:hypothetical protein
LPVDRLLKRHGEIGASKPSRYCRAELPSRRPHTPGQRKLPGFFLFAARSRRRVSGTQHAGQIPDQLPTIHGQVAHQDSRHLLALLMIHVGLFPILRIQTVYRVTALSICAFETLSVYSDGSRGRCKFPPFHELGGGFTARGRRSLILWHPHS